jgi:hypothetical protein
MTAAVSAKAQARAKASVERAIAAIRDARRHLSRVDYLDADEETEALDDATGRALLAFDKLEAKCT